MKIFLVRHGMDEEGYRGGWSQRGLIEEGITQSERLGDYLYHHSEQYKINTMISSDLPRAVQTTKELEKRLDRKAHYLKDWREMNNGDLAGMPNKEAEVKYAGIYFNSLGMDTPFPGGESPRNFHNRICTSFGDLCQSIEQQKVESNVLLVTHGGVINILYYLLGNRNWTNTSEFHSIGNTSIHTVEKGLNGWEFSSMNMMSHLG
jgi:probable phosphoglycerate mutase